ncbi:MAG: plasmid stabilization protein [Alcanivorax sp. Nap_24]|nr:MAG: plasmid stabilization protein [Alcanivorax sp. Nap_24]
MNTLTVRNLDDELKLRLRLEAARHGHSMEEEVRQILRRALNQPAEDGLGTRIRERFAPYDGQELELPDRRDPPRAADLEP